MGVLHILGEEPLVGMEYVYGRLTAHVTLLDPEYLQG